MVKKLYKVLNEDYFNDIEITDKDIQNTTDNDIVSTSADTKHVYNHDIILSPSYDSRWSSKYNAEQKMLIKKHRAEYIFDNSNIIDKYEIQFITELYDFPYDCERYDVGNGIIWWGLKKYIDDKSLEEQYNSIKDKSNYPVKVRLLFDSTTDNIKDIQKLLLYIRNAFANFHSMYFKAGGIKYEILSNEIIHTKSSILSDFIRFKKSDKDMQKLWNNIDYFNIAKFYLFIKQFTPNYGINKLRDFLGVNDLKHYIDENSSSYKTVYYEHIDYGYDIHKLLAVMKPNNVLTEMDWQYYNLKSSNFYEVPDLVSIYDYIYKRKPGINVYFVRCRPGNRLCVYYYFDKTYSENDGINEFDLILRHYVYDEDDIIKLLAPMYCIGCDIKKAIISTKKIKDDFNGYYILDKTDINSVIDEIKRLNSNADE